jgi:hypothetical protein
MIRKLSLPEIVEAIQDLGPDERALIIELLGRGREDAARRVGDLQDEAWFASSAKGLSRAYGPQEPDYSEKDLVP